jgi:putative ABC transport system permease protein
MFRPLQPLAKIAMAKLVRRRDRCCAHGPVFVSPLRPRNALRAVDPKCESHLIFSMGLSVRYTLRNLRDSLGLTVTILLTLAIGIGATTAIFTVVYATLLAPTPYPHPDRLVNVWSKIQGHRNFASLADLADWRRRSTVFEQLETATPDNFNFATQDKPEYIEGMEATTGYNAMFGNPLLLGRNFLPEEGQPGKEHVVILTHRLWLHLGANPKILGQTMQINGELYTVVGVLMPGAPDRWGPQSMVPLVIKPDQLTDHASRYWVATGRLKPGVTIRQAQAEMDAIAAQEARDFPKTNQDWGAVVEPFKNDFLPSETHRLLWLLLGAVGFLLLLACLNVANLLLARSMTRQREVAIRGALGASPASIFTQFLAESLALAVLGGALGIALGSLLLRGLTAVIPADSLPPEADLRLNLPVLLILLSAATLAGVLFGCIPAWYASRLDPAGALKEGGRSGTGLGRHRLRRLLVIAEFAVALPLLAGAGLTIHSFWNLNHVDLGVRTDHVLGFYVDSVPLMKNPTQSNTNAYYARALAAIAAVPGVSHASAMTYLPLDFLHTETQFSIAGQSEYANPAMRPNADFQTVTPDYFATFGIRVVKGRAFNDHDDISSVKVAMVNEAFANRFLKGLDPLGHRVLMEQEIPNLDKAGPVVAWQIVGVFHTVKSRNSREDNPEIDTPFWQEAYPISGIAVRTAQDPAIMIKSIQAAMNALDPQAAFALTRTMDQVHDQVLSNDRFALILFASFATVGLLLASVGIYGVMAFSVAQRSREMALRMALGATRNSVTALVMREGAVLACAGSGLGFIGAYFVGRAMQTVLFGVGAIDPSAFGAGGAIASARGALGLLPACASGRRRRDYAAAEKRIAKQLFRKKRAARFVVEKLGSAALH